MKYVIEVENSNGKVRIETQHAESARRFIDALEKIEIDEILDSMPQQIPEQAG